MADMGNATPRSTRRRRGLLVVAPLATAGVLALVGALGVSSMAYAATTTVGLGTVGSYSVIAGSTVTNTGPSVLSGDVGVSPGTAITGFPPGVALGAEHRTDAAAAQAKSDLVVAYDDAASRASDGNLAADIGGRTLTDGVYTRDDALAITGTLTLNGQGLANQVWIFQVADTLITATDSRINLINGANACNVYWQIGSSATLGTDSQFVGTIMALQSISVTTGTVVQGRALARNGAVTLDNNVFTNALCTAAQPTVTTSATATTTATSTVTASPTRTVTAPPSTITSPGPTTTTVRPTTRVSVPGPTRTRTTSGPTTTVTRTLGGAAGSSIARAAASSSSAAVGTGNDRSGGKLASTGANTLLLPFVGGAVVLTIAGGLLIARGRRPKSRHS